MLVCEYLSGSSRLECDCKCMQRVCGAHVLPSSTPLAGGQKVANAYDLFLILLSAGEENAKKERANSVTGL